MVQRGLDFAWGVGVSTNWAIRLVLAPSDTVSAIRVSEQEAESVPIPGAIRFSPILTGAPLNSQSSISHVN